MCDPMSMTSVMVSAAGQALSFQAQKQQYEQHEEYRQQNAVNANKAYIEKTTQTNIRQAQENEAAVQKKFDLNKEAAQARGTTVASSENDGMSLDNLLADYERQRGGYNDIISQNLKMNSLESKNKIAGYRSEAVDRANSVRPASPPSAAAALLGVGGAALDAYSTYHIRKSKDIRTAG